MRLFRHYKYIKTLLLLPLKYLLTGEIGPNPTGVTADAAASRIDKKKSSPENCIFFLPIRFHLTLTLKPQRRIACPIILLPRNSCMNTTCFFSALDYIF